ASRGLTPQGGSGRCGGGEGPGRSGRGRCARASRRRPGQAVAASETPGTGGFRGGSVTGTGRMSRRRRGFERSGNCAVRNPSPWADNQPRRFLTVEDLDLSVTTTVPGAPPVTEMPRSAEETCAFARDSPPARG